MQDKVTIDQALDAFLADQRCRLSARTMRNYDDVVDLLRHCLNGYGPNALICRSGLSTGRVKWCPQPSPWAPLRVRI